MLDATVALLLERSPEDLTIREIAERAGHHHRFVSEWFGSKAGLYRAAFPILFARVASDDELPWVSGTVNRPEMRSALAVVNWLMARAPELLLDDPPRLAADRLQDFYEQIGMEPSLARLLTQRILVTAMGATLFARLVGASDEDLEQHRALELRILGLLVADQS